jgi:hypothetical protein
MKFTWTRIKGCFVCVKLTVDGVRHEAYFWADGSRQFAVKAASGTKVDQFGTRVG